MLLKRHSNTRMPTPAVKRMSFLLNTWVYGEAIHTDRSRARQALDAAFDEIKRLERLLSRFLENSVISQINREADQAPVWVDREIFCLLEQSLVIAQRSQGAFDITTAPLCDLWREAEKRGSIPSELEVHEKLSRTGYQFLKLDPGQSTVSFLKNGMGVDLGAIGKGYILDCAARFLKDRGIENGLLNAGGNIVSWNPNGSRIGVRDPLDCDKILCTVFLKNEAVATSANDERFFLIEKQTYGHILDPRTGWPMGGDLISVSVVAENAMMADALSTALFVLGEDQGVPVAKALGARETLFHKSNGMQR